MLYDRAQRQDVAGERELDGATCDHATADPIPFPVVWDKDGQIGRQFLGILGTPTTFIVDKSGRLVSKTVGAIDFDKLRHFLDGSLS